MIGSIITDASGNPIDSQGTKLSQSNYQPSLEVKKLYERCQRDYQTGYSLQHRTFNEFDGISLVQRANLDQQTFGAFVGAEYVPAHKKWRWRGRKNTARNKLMGILSHMLSAMLFPYVKAVNDKDEEDKMTARVMGILIEDHLRRAGYDLKFLYIVLTALVNPAVIVHVEYVEAMQKIKQRLKDGTIQIIEAVDEILSGLQLHIVPVDELLIGDFYTGEMQQQPFIVRVRRISWDAARAIYGAHPDFQYVEAGKTRIVMTGQENQILYDIEWTEADRNFVQELTFSYRSEDAEFKFVGGVFMGNPTDVYNSNPFPHRRLSLIKDEWISVPVYPYAKSGFEPIDPTGRFFYYKSGAFKEYWDDATQNFMTQMLLDGTALEVMKPIFISGMGKVDTTVMIPGAVVGMPANATVSPYSSSPVLSAAYEAIAMTKEDMSESTQDKILSGGADPGVTAYATQAAEQNARIFLGNFGALLAKLVEDIGALTMDCIIQHATIGEIDASVPEAINMKFRTFISEGKERGKKVTNRILFTTKYMGRKLTEKELEREEWRLYDKAGGHESDQRLYEVNPELFRKHRFGLYVDADQIVSKSMGTDQQRSALALQVLTSPAVAPYTDQEAVIEDFAIEPFADGDPDRYKRKGNVNDMMMAAMGGAPPGQPLPQMANQLPTQQPMTI